MKRSRLRKIKAQKGDSLNNQKAMKKKTCKAPAKRRKFGNKTYNRSAKTMTKTAAKARQKKIGHGRIIKNPCGKGFYLYS